MSPSFADQALRIRWVALATVLFVAAQLVPPLAGALRPPAIRFDTEVESLVTPAGELTIDWDDSGSSIGLLVRRWQPDGTAIILGMIPVGSNEDFGMVCDADTGNPRHLLFGATRERDVSGEPGELTGYDGPPAVGARFKAGMYLVVLEAGDLDPATEITLRRTTRLTVRRASLFDDVVRYGKQEPASGCFVA
jgi:hypothetical protein